MRKIMKFQDYQKTSQIAEEFLEKIINPTMNESNLNDDMVKDILKKLQNDLKFNFGLVFSFGTGIGLMYPIVLNLIKNSKLSVELTPENIVLLTLTTLCICYLEDNKNISGLEDIVCPDCDGSVECPTCNGTGELKSKVNKQDARKLLTELQLRGIGNGIVKKMVKCFDSISKLLRSIFRNSEVVVKTLLDMFAYTSLLIPTLNAINWLTSQNSYTIDNLGGNLLSIGVAIIAFLSKYGFNYLVDKIKANLPNKKTIGSQEIKDGQSDLEGNQLIKEQ